MNARVELPSSAKLINDGIPAMRVRHVDATLLIPTSEGARARLDAGLAYLGPVQRIQHVLVEGDLRSAAPIFQKLRELTAGGVVFPHVSLAHPTDLPRFILDGHHAELVESILRPTASDAALLVEGCVLEDEWQPKIVGVRRVIVASSDLNVPLAWWHSLANAPVAPEVYVSSCAGGRVLAESQLSAVLEARGGAYVSDSALHPHHMQVTMG